MKLHLLSAPLLMDFENCSASALPQDIIKLAHERAVCISVCDTARKQSCMHSKRVARCETSKCVLLGWRLLRTIDVCNLHSRIYYTHIRAYNSQRRVGYLLTKPALPPKRCGGFILLCIQNTSACFSPLATPNKNTQARASNETHPWQFELIFSLVHPCALH
jgi:hypothetical protein